MSAAPPAAEADRWTPPDWSYNPSAHRERYILAGLALVGCAIATYLALYQAGFYPTVWEPFFGHGSVTILHSAVARLLPIPDAALGAVGYALDVLFGALGGRDRWRTAPWLVFAFGVVVAALGVGSVLLVILQPVAFGAWCTLCLCSAAISINLAGPGLSECLAAAQHLARERARGRSVWRALWGRGDCAEEA